MNKTIHELNSLSQAEATDELIIYDVSEGESKKIQVENLVGNPNYSTDETFTGQYWIDGKPIYRKVINFNSETEISTSGTNFTLSTLGLSDIDNIFSVYAFNTTGSKTTKRRSSPLSMYWESDTSIQLRACSCITSFFLCLVIEYTKAS